MKLYRIKPLVWDHTSDGNLANAPLPGGRRYRATSYDVTLYERGDYAWSSKCESVEHGKQIAEDLWLSRITPMLEEVTDTANAKRLACPNCQSGKLTKCSPTPQSGDSPAWRCVECSVKFIITNPSYITAELEEAQP